jgi:galactokinase
MTQSHVHQREFPEDLNAYTTRIKRLFGGVFAPGREIFVARAPGRLDVMGGIAEYSGSVILESTLKEATIVGVQKRNDRRILLRSLGIENKGFAGIVEFHLDDFYSSGKVKSYDALHAELGTNSQKSWAAHIVGAFAVLLTEGLIERFDQGASIAVDSSIPLDAGVGSSAALEVAAFYAIQHAYNLPLDNFQLTRSCQIIENQIIGMPSGIMDQVSSAMGQKGNLLMMRCQPHELLKMVSVPKGFQFVGINSGIRHPASCTRYRDARVATFMGRRMIFSRVQKYAGQIPYGGYLCNIPIDEWNDGLRKQVSGKILGQEFLDKYQFHDDPATQVEPEKRYNPRSRAEHAIMENARTLRLGELLEGTDGASDEDRMIEAGRLIYESHQSYDKNCGLATKETDLIVRLAKEQGPEKGVYGAKVTNKGSGGTVVILSAANSNDVVRNIAAEYMDATKREPDLFFGSSQGAFEMGMTSVSFE